MARYQTLRPWLAVLGFLAIVALGSNPATAQPPGPESFAVDPRTPLELWGAIDYLTRTGQAPKAVPYLERFNKSKIDDPTWIAIRDRYGAGSILRLDDDKSVRKYTEPLIKSFTTAMRKVARSPDRIARLVGELTSDSAEEQDFGVRKLREAGSFAAPRLAAVLVQPGLSAEDRALLVRNMGRLDGSAIPGLAAMLDSPNAVLASDAATALGLIGDPEALPFLAYPAAAADGRPPVKAAAQAAIANITGRPFSAQLSSPVQVLTAAAWAYHRHHVEFDDDPILIWKWDAAKGAPAPFETARSEAEATLGLRFAREALRLDPANHAAQVVQLSLALEKSIERTGYGDFPAKDQAVYTAAVASGARVLADVMKTAVADGKSDLAAAAVQALGRVVKPRDLAGPRLNPLVEALYGPGRRIQFAAAKALVDLDPKGLFPGSSRVVPILARFVLHQADSRAIVIDANPNRGSQIAGFLIELGYDSELEPVPTQGFRAAIESADVELILVSYDLFRPGWNLKDLLANLKADSRTATIPLLIYGPLELAAKHPNLKSDFPGVRLLVQPASAALLKAQLGAPKPSLPAEERTAYSNEAIALFAKITSTPGSSFTKDLPTALPLLAADLIGTDSAPTTAAVLGRIPHPNAQRALADVLLDPSRTPEFRGQVAKALVASIDTFGALVSADQEARLTEALRVEAGSPVAGDLTRVTQALSRKTPGSRGRPVGGARLGPGAAR